MAQYEFFVYIVGPVTVCLTCGALVPADYQALHDATHPEVP